jgi:hypothetical protein
MADHRITVECDDHGLFTEFFVMFGGSEPVPGRPAIQSDIHLDIRARVHPDFGWFRLIGTKDAPIDGHEYSFALDVEDGAFEQLSTGEPGWKCIAQRGSNVPMLAFRGRDCLFALTPQWPRNIMWYLFWHLLRRRSDAIFFHASALGIFREGTIFVGAAGSGKSTTALALAARGHNLLSDEIAGYVPARGELIPFRRPVGIKPGPRAAAVERGLASGGARRVVEDTHVRAGFVRVDVDELFATELPRPFPLRRIVFLRGFAATPSLERITPGREEIAELQPLMSSFLNETRSRRVFELARLLSAAKVYRLHPGNPDATAVYLEEAFACEK